MKKVAVVLGTSGGLGLAIASSLLKNGYRVFGGSRGESPIDHDDFFDIEIDLTQKKQIKNFMKALDAETEVVDLLVNAAGMCQMKSFSDSTDLDLRMHLETNVIGYFNFLKEFEAFILEDETHLINIFSISAKSFFPNTVSYSTSEFAKKSMLGVLELEWKKYGIRFSSLYAGAIDSPMWQDYMGENRDKMLSIADFLYMFESVAFAPADIQLPEMTFLHKDGFIN